MILNRQRAVRVSAAPLGIFLKRVQRKLRVPAGAVTVCFVEDAEMARLNRMHRGRRGSTDVLSFPAHGNGARSPGWGAESAEGRFLGDIAISPVMARRNARRGGRSLAAELRILTLHGVLHLLGYDHETDNGEMLRKEARLRREFGLAPPN